MTAHDACDPGVNDIIVTMTGSRASCTWLLFGHERVLTRSTLCVLLDAVPRRALRQLASLPDVFEDDDRIAIVLASDGAFHAFWYRSGHLSLYMRAIA